MFFFFSSRIEQQGRSHRDRSDSRDRDRRRNRPNVRNDKDIGRNGNDKRSSAEVEPKPAIQPNQLNAMNSIYQQNVPFSSNISQYMMKQMNNPNAGIINPLAGQSEQVSAFSTNDVRTMNMNMTLQTNPLAFQQQLYSQQQPVNMPAFNTFSPTAGVLQNAQNQHHQQIAAGMSGPMNKFGMNNGIGNQNANGPYCVRIRNLCNLTNYSAIRKFFVGLLIPNDGIKMINDSDGNRTGQAYVRFARPNFVQLAIQRSNQKLGRNIIKIEELDEKTYEEAIDAYRPPRRNNYRDHDRDRDRRYRRNSRDYSDDDDDDDDDDERNSSKGNSDNDRDDVMCISDSNDSKESPPFTTVLIEDLPPFTKEQDIMKLFSSYPLVHIVMAKRPKMFSSYVKFHSADDARAAVKNTACHKISFKTVYISACSEEEFETARKEFSGELDLDIGMPKANVEDNSSSSNDKNDANDIKSPNTSVQNDDYMNDGSNDMANPIAGVSLENIPGVNLNDPRINTAKFPFLKNINNPTDAKHSTERIDPRTKSTIQASIPNNTFNGFGIDASTMMAQQQSMMDMNMSMNEVCCILIENMEYRTTEMEIVEWIQGKANLTPIRIQLLVNERNQTNGNGFIQFANNEQASRAMELLDKAQFKSRVVHVSLAPWQQIMTTIQTITQILRENGFDGIDTSGNIPRQQRFNNNNPNNRFPNNNRFNNNGHNNRMPNNRPNNRNGGNMNGCIVSMSNVPYKATVDDILDFFSDFDLCADDIMRRYNDEGKPTGDARVRFESPSEARRAIDLRDKCRLTNRPVYLQLFNQH